VFQILNAIQNKEQLMSTVMNTHAIRQTIKRLFDGNLTTVIGELLQNAQRSKATLVKFQTLATGFSVDDNGHGILGMDGFKTLLTLGDSKFENTLVKFQHPMGVGFHALLALENIEKVIVKSGHLKLELDTKKWWTDENYYNNWEKLISENPFIEGTKIGVWTAEPELLGKMLIEAFKPDTSIAKGYQGILDITLDGEPVDTSLPHKITEAPLLFSYQDHGATISIYESNAYWSNQNLHLIRHFGQLLHFPNERKEYYFHILIDITGEAPFDLKAPVRDGVIINERYRQFVSNLEDKLFEVFPTIPASKNYRYLKHLYDLNHQRMYDLPYVGIAKPEFSRKETQYISENGEYESQTHHQVVSKSSLPLIVDEAFTYNIDGQDYDGENIANFIPILNRARLEPFVITLGNNASVSSAKLVWTAGETFNDEVPYVRKLGKLTLTTPHGNQDIPFLETDTVYAVQNASSYLDYSEFCIGTNNNPGDVLDKIGMVAYEDDNDAPDDARDDFEDELAKGVRILKNIAPRPIFEKSSFTRYARHQGLTSPKLLSLVFKEDGLATATFKDEEETHAFDIPL
jgi:hypothetical protein